MGSTEDRAGFASALQSAMSETSARPISPVSSSSEGLVRRADKTPEFREAGFSRA